MQGLILLQNKFLQLTFDLPGLFFDLVQVLVPMNLVSLKQLVELFFVKQKAIPILECILREKSVRVLVRVHIRANFQLEVAYVLLDPPKLFIQLSLQRLKCYNAPLFLGYHLNRHLVSEALHQ